METRKGATRQQTTPAKLYRIAIILGAPIFRPAGATTRQGRIAYVITYHKLEDLFKITGRSSAALGVCREGNIWNEPCDGDVTENG